MAQTNPEPIKIDKWDGSALKNALDDCAKNVLKENYGFVENFRLLDGRLFLCTIAVLFAILALLWDWLHPFPESRPVLILCVLSYFVLSGIITVYVFFVESGCFYVGHEKDRAGIDPDNIWTMKSSLKRFDDKFKLTLNYKDGISKQQRSADIEKSVAAFFDETGVLAFKVFEAEIIKLKESLDVQRKTQ